MKTSILLFVLLFCLSCGTSINYEAEEAAIKEVVDQETRYAAAADLDNWRACWVAGDMGNIIMSDATGYYHYTDLDELGTALSDMEPFDLELRRDNYDFVIGDNEAFVSFDQHDNWGGDERHTKETRTLRKVDGEWKIVSGSVLGVSSYEVDHTPFHAVAQNIPPNDAGFQMVSGKGGMTIGYVDIPQAMDFSPLFKGLPQDMCISDHWGYVLDGSLEIEYPGGKTETYSAGEVFYWPAPHTGKIPRGAKFIDFSPDASQEQLMDHIASLNAGQ